MSPELSLLSPRPLTRRTSARFAPITHPVGDQYTSSPKLKPFGANPSAAPRPPQRQATMSERITQRLKEFRLNAGNHQPQQSGRPEKPDVQFDADVEEEKQIPKLDKGKGRATDPAFRVVRASLTVSVSPVFAADLRGGVEEMLDSMLMRCALC